MPFTKLDSGILQSSIMSEPPNVFKTWIALLAACGPDGLARVSVTYLSAVCFLPIEETEIAISRLMCADRNSRSTNDDGRRIERVDGGYRLVNFLKYREHTDSMTPGAIRIRKWRERKRYEALRNVTDVTVTHVSASASDLNLKGGIGGESVTPVTGQEGTCPTNTPPEKTDPHDADIDAIIDFLNQTCGTEYRKTTEATRRVIRARLSDGASVEDCKDVIRNQHRLWAGTDQEKYLRPETLFKAAKFESYLADAKRTVMADGGKSKWQ